MEGSGESSKTEARIYTNKEAVARVKNIPNTPEGYQIARLEAQVDYDDTQMGTKREKLEKLEAEIKELNQIISQLEGQDYPTEEEAQSSKERIDQARAKISTDEAQIEQTQKEAEELRIRTENLQQQIPGSRRNRNEQRCKQKELRRVDREQPEEEHMILYVGDEISGYFVQGGSRYAKRDHWNISKPVLKIEHQVTEILRRSPDYLIIAVEQYAEAVDVIAEEIRNIARAKNTTIIIHAPGYDPESKMIRALKAKGIQYFIYSGSAAGAREELERALEGYYPGPDPEELAPEILEQEERKGKKIGVVGACKRMGTTTAAIQLLQHLQLRGYRACYIEMNPNGFVQARERNFECVP